MYPACSKGLFALFIMVIANLSTVGHSAYGAVLDDYVALEDVNYSYRLLSTTRGEGYATYVLELTSQAWLTSPEVDRTLWRHWLTIIRPDEATGTMGLLCIGGGTNASSPPTGPSAALTHLAMATQSVAAELTNVPNQPLTFADDGTPRVEDALVAYSWRKFLDTGEPRWIANLPMTKSAVRAMDATQAFLRSPKGGNIMVEKFVVLGTSKRGWTAWLTAAVDKRVAGIIPRVIDVLHVKRSMQHNHRVYDGWIPAVQDYVDAGIMDRMGDARFARLMHIVDPLAYKARYTMPKYLVNATGDQFFVPDGSRYYFDQLPGERYLRYVPNSDHSLAGTDAQEGIVAFYHALVTGTPRPEFSWTISRDGVIEVHTKTPPTQVRVWTAVNPSARDFRLETIGKAWRYQPLEPIESGVYRVQMEKPEEGWGAGFVELTYSSGCTFPFVFTTGVTVMPDVYLTKAQ